MKKYKQKTIYQPQSNTNNSSKKLDDATRSMFKDKWSKQQKKIQKKIEENKKQSKSKQYSHLEKSPQKQQEMKQNKNYGKKHKKHHHHGRKRQTNECKYWKKGMKRMLSKSESHSPESSDSENSQKEQQKKQIKDYSKQSPQEALGQKYYDFFKRRKINFKQQDRILSFLCSLSQEIAPEYLQYFICQIENHNCSRNIPYLRMLRVLVRFNFDLGATCEKLSKIKERKDRKMDADEKYEELTEETEKVPFLEKEDLEQIDPNNSIFVIDGNNIMPSCKLFRPKCFSKNQKDKVDCQIRLKLIVGHSLKKQNAFLFFDDIYPEELQEQVKNNLISQRQRQYQSKIEVHSEQGKRADDLIVQKMLQFAKQNKKDVILVSADRELSIRCYKAHSCKKTAGRFFIKYCIGLMKQKYHQKTHPMKGIIKKIRHLDYIQ